MQARTRQNPSKGPTQPNIYTMANPSSIYLTSRTRHTPPMHRHSTTTILCLYLALSLSGLIFHFQQSAQAPPTWPPASPYGHTPSACCTLCCVPRREHRQLKSSKKRPSKQKGQDVVCGGAAQIRWSLLLLLLCRIRVLLDPSMYSVLVHWSLLLLPPSRSVCY